MTDQRDDAAFKDWAAFEAWFEKNWSKLLYKPAVRMRIRQDVSYGWHAALAYERQRAPAREQEVRKILLHLLNGDSDQMNEAAERARTWLAGHAEPVADAD